MASSLTYRLCEDSSLVQDVDTDELGGDAVRRIHLVVVLIVTAAFCLPLTASSQAVGKKVVSGDSPEHKYALVAGSSTFEYLLQWKIPPGPGDYPGIMDYGPIPADAFWHDVTCWRDLLINNYHWLSSHITLQLNESNTKANIINQITAMKQYDSPESLFLIVLIGHGWVETDKNSLLPGDEWNGIPIPGVDAYVDGTLLPSGQNVQRVQGVDPCDEVFMPYDGMPSGIGKQGGMANFISDDEFKLLLDALNFQGKVVVSFSCCCGGGLCEDIQRPGMLALGVGNSDQLEMHWWEIHDYWTYALAGAKDLPSYIHLTMNPDINGDGKVSLEEAYYWTVAAQKATDPTIIAWGGGQVDLYMFDGIQGETFL
jgi:hypothetical protein